MEVLYAICCGLDVHKASVTACLRSPGVGAQRHQEVRTFGTTTRELLQLVDWLTTARCTHVVMESTGVYWRPVYNLLEGSVELFLVNAQHVKTVPGRKTAVRDSEWLAQLRELGLLRRRFVPPAAQRELRDVVRDRKRLLEDRAGRRPGSRRSSRPRTSRSPVSSPTSSGCRRARGSRRCSPAPARPRRGRSADSGRSRTAGPIDGEHRFRRKPNTRSDRRRTLIPGGNAR